MRYIIERTSNCGDNPKCEGAFKVTAKERKDIRTFKNKEEWLKKFPKDEDRALRWGVTKDKEPYRVCRVNIDLWLIDIEDLREFVCKYGHTILSPPKEEYIGYEDLFIIEVYDSYRE